MHNRPSPELKVIDSAEGIACLGPAAGSVHAGRAALRDHLMSDPHVLFGEAVLGNPP